MVCSLPSFLPAQLGAPACELRLRELGLWAPCHPVYNGYKVHVCRRRGYRAGCHVRLFQARCAERRAEPIIGSDPVSVSVSYSAFVDTVWLLECSPLE